MNDSELRVHLMGHTRKELDGRTWTTTVHCSDGTIHLGRGLTHEQAIDDGVVKFREYEAFLALSPEDQLREIMKKERILDTDKERCIRLLTELVLGDRE